MRERNHVGSNHVGRFDAHRLQGDVGASARVAPLRKCHYENMRIRLSGATRALAPEHQFTKFMGSGSGAPIPSVSRSLLEAVPRGRRVALHGNLVGSRRAG